MEVLSQIPFNCKIEEFKISTKMMKISIFEKRGTKKFLSQENIKTKFKFKVQLLMKFSHFLKEYLYKTRVKAQFNKALTLLKINYRINREVDNQLKPKHLALKVEHYKCKNKIKKRHLKDGIHKKLLNNSETILLNLRKSN